MNDIVIPEITIGFWELPTAALIMVVFLVSGMAISNKRDWLKKTLWRKEALFWVLGTISVALLIPAIGHIFGLLYLMDIADLTTGDQRGFAIILAAIVGAPFVIWRTWVAQRQADTDEQGLITDRINNAVAGLGAEKTVWVDDKQTSVPNLEVRLGGIYALERIAKDSGRDHVTVMEILCAYIRENSPASTKNSYPIGANEDFNKYIKWRVSIDPIRVDIQAILDVIGRRDKRQILKEKETAYRLDIRSCNLQRTDFRKGNFNNAQLDDCDLDLAVLREAKLNLAELKWAKLNGTDLISADLSGADIYMSELNRAHLNWAKLSGTDLNMANLSRTSLYRTDFSDTDIKGVSVKYTDLSKALNLSKNQVDYMFGDKTTILIDEMKETPDHWPTEELDSVEFHKRWEVYKKTNP